MREIKFRAFYREMFNIDVLAISPCTWDCADNKRGVSLAYQSHIPVMQYTGLKDKGGKEIYEGDIVLVNKERAYEITINDFMQIPVIDSEVGQQELYQVNKNCEVIGNIYENPELLK